MQRRRALTTLALAGAASLLPGTAFSATQPAHVSSTASPTLASQSAKPASVATSVTPGYYKLPPLPYAFGDLEPAIDAQTVQLHYEKHHAGYLEKFNQALLELEEYVGKKVLWPKNPEKIFSNEWFYKLLEKVPGRSKWQGSLEFYDKEFQLREKLWRQGGGYINHIVYWNSLQKHQLSPRSYHWIFGEPLIYSKENKTNEGIPLRKLAQAVDQAFGNIDALGKELKEKSLSIFGSGWAWLVTDQFGKLEITTTANQDTPFLGGRYPYGQYPLLGIDVWEHAYYLKYQNKRADYIDALLGHLNMINWHYAAQRYMQSAKFFEEKVIPITRDA